jgi:hypothetical protein
MPKLVGLNIVPNPQASGSDGTLDVGFVDSESDDSAGSGMNAGGVAWEHPRPLPGELASRVLGGQTTGQLHWNSSSDVLLPDHSGGFDLVADGGDQETRQTDDPVFGTFGHANHELLSGQVNVLEAQTAGFDNAQAATIEQVDDKPGGVAKQVLASRQESVDLVNGGGVSDHGRANRTKGGNITQGLRQGFLVEEVQGVECLVLGGGADALMGELSQESLDLPLAGQPLAVPIFQVVDKPKQPTDITLLGGDREVLTADGVAEFLDGLIFIHDIRTIG